MTPTAERRFTSFPAGFSRVSLCPLWLCFLLLILTATACSKGDPATPASNAAASVVPEPKAPPADSTPDTGPLPQIDSKRAFHYIKDIVAFGTRPMGSENHKKVENYIMSHLKGDQVEDDAFIADTVEGKFPVRSIIAK